MQRKRLTQRFALCIDGKPDAAVAECQHDICVMRCRCARRHGARQHDVIAVAVFAKLLQHHLGFCRRDRNASAVELGHGMVFLDL